MVDQKIRLESVRKKMKEKGIEGYIVKGTDRYLNEYVPTEESTRVWLTGFSGSTGDALVTKRHAYLFVDGRYYLQADQEVNSSMWTVIKVPMGTSLQGALIEILLRDFKEGKGRIGIETDRFSVRGFQDLKRKLESISVECVPVVPSIVEEVRGPLEDVIGEVWEIDTALTGRSVEEKLALVRQTMKSENIDVFICQKLDEIAYLTNLRGNEMSFQSTFKSVAMVKPNECWVALSGGSARSIKNPSSSIQFINDEGWVECLKRTGHSVRVGFDPSSATEWTRTALEKEGLTPVPMSSPLVPMKAKKNLAEITHMIQSFERADAVVWRAQTWLCKQMEKGKVVTEVDFAEKVYELFKKSGAWALSFKVISAAGKNGAVIHYSKPDPKKVVSSGELMLLDTGAYYEGGYATDLTRTFLVGGKGVKGSPEQRRIFTLVLKGAISGMSARFPEGTHGTAVDALVRGPLWEAGYTYNHGTGHGVGINVHEAPPSLSLHGDYILEKGHIFSIEPGIYIPKFGGVRIENLCTVVEDPQVAGWLCIVPLTFSLLDERLMDSRILSEREKAWLKWYKKESKKKHTKPPEPPVL